jgi:hypothetical protein
MANGKKVLLILIILILGCEHKKFKNPVDPHNYPPPPILIYPANDTLIPENPPDPFRWQVKEDSNNILFGEPMECKLEITTDENFSNAESIIIPLHAWQPYPYQRFFGDSTYYWRVSTRYRGGSWGESSEIFSLRVKFPIIYESKFNGKNLEIKDNYLFLADDSGFVKIFDITEPSTPVYIKEFAPTNFSASFLFFKDEYLYTLDYNRYRFCIVDIRNPLNPELLTSLMIFHPEGLWVEGNYAYIISHSKEVIVLNVTDPESVYIRDTLSGISDVNTIVVKENFLYALKNYEFSVFDLSSDTIIAVLGVGGNSFYLEGDYAYIIGSNLINIVNISNPFQPVIEVTSAQAGNYIYKKDNLIFIQTSRNLEVFDASDIRNLIKLGEITEINCSDLVIKDDKIIIVSPLRIFGL